MNSSASPPPAGNKPTDPKDAGDEGTAITVAAPAISLILVLGAIVVWFFLVRIQLRKKAKQNHRLKNSKRSQGGSLREGQSKQNGAKASRLSPQGTPLSHKKGGHGSLKEKHHNCRCLCDEIEKFCNCGVSHQNATNQVTSNGISTVCTGNSPFCPHSTRMQHHADIHTPVSSLSLGLNDYPLSDSRGIFDSEPRSRANTGDFTPLVDHKIHQKDCNSAEMVLQQSDVGDDEHSPPSNCVCHPLSGFEYKQCSCVMKHQKSRKKRKDKADWHYYSAPSLVDKQLISPC